jgi:hypothetical protein
MLYLAFFFVMYKEICVKRIASSPSVMFLSVINSEACGHIQQTGFIPHVVMTLAHMNA